MTDRPRVLVPDRILPSVLDRVASTFELVSHLRDAPAGILTTINVRVDDRYLELAGPQLRVVANYAVGVDNIDLAAAAARGVIVTNTPDVLTDATAELTVGLMLSLLRRISEGDRLLRRGTPWRFALDFMLGESLRGKKLGVVGAGRIGRATAELARSLGAVPVFIGRHDRLESALRAVDIVSLHCPLTDRTRHMIDHRTLAAMKPSAFLVNTARGQLVDEAALADGLEEKTIAGAALDVFEYEPQVTARLLDLENVVVTPHIGSATLPTREAMGFVAVRALEQALIERRTPETQVPVRRAPGMAANESCNSCRPFPLSPLGICGADVGS